MTSATSTPTTSAISSLSVESLPRLSMTTSSWSVISQGINLTPPYLSLTKTSRSGVSTSTSWRRQWSIKTWSPRTTSSTRTCPISLTPRSRTWVTTCSSQQRSRWDQFPVWFLDWSLIFQEFGVTEVRDLIPDGRNVLVTDVNKADYIRLVCQERMTGAIRKQLAAFLEGFYDIIPRR